MEGREEGSGRRGRKGGEVRDGGKEGEENIGWIRRAEEIRMDGFRRPLQKEESWLKVCRLTSWDTDVM